jgi:hypothetical protein
VLTALVDLTPWETGRAVTLSASESVGTRIGPITIVFVSIAEMLVSVDAPGDAPTDDARIPETAAHTLISDEHCRNTHRLRETDQRNYSTDIRG